MGPTKLLPKEPVGLSGTKRVAVTEDKKLSTIEKSSGEGRISEGGVFVSELLDEGITMLEKMCKFDASARRSALYFSIISM